MAARIVIATAGWTDPRLLDYWYPYGMAAVDRLFSYAERFAAVEVNNTFYRVPPTEMVARWAWGTPVDFTFDVKLHRLLSRHSTPITAIPVDLWSNTEVTLDERVRPTPWLRAAVLERLLAALEPMRQSGKLNSLLLQLAPWFSPQINSLHELDDIIDRCRPTKVAVEFRNRGWVERERVSRTLDYLAEREATFVCVDTPAVEHERIMPRDFTAVTCPTMAYLRVHGRDCDHYLNAGNTTQRYSYPYTDPELHEIADRALYLAAHLTDGATRVVFNDNHAREAPDAAQRLQEILARRTEPERQRSSHAGGAYAAA
jgi:uncharacterized protein YecE (DUF72 family)